MTKSTLGQISAAPVGFAQGGFGAPFSGAFPVGVPPVTGVCPPGFLAAPSAIVPGGYTCLRAPGSFLAGKR